MINGVNPSNEYKVSNGAITQQDLGNTLSKSKQAVSDNFESNSAVKVLSNTVTEESSKTDKLALALVLNILDKSIDKKMGGWGDKGILSKFAKAGDYISNKLHLDHIISKESSGRISNFIKNNRFTKYFASEYEAIPKTSFAKGQSMAEKYTGALNEYIKKILSGSDITVFRYNPELMEALIKDGAVSEETISFLKQVGPLTQDITPEYLEKVSASLTEIASKLGNSSQTQALQKNITGLQKSISEYLAGTGAKKASSMADSIASILKTIQSDKIAEILKNNSAELSEETKNVLSSLSTKTFSNEQVIKAIEELSQKGIDLDKGKLSELVKKYRAANSELGSTMLGNKFAQGAIKTKDIVTYGGGIISLIFTASAIMNAVKATKEAPKGEKKSTFMHVLSEQYLGIILFQPSIKLMYKLGGNKYRGMTVEARNALKELIQNTNANRELTKEGLKIAKLQRDLLIKGVAKDKVDDLANMGLKEAKNLAKNLKKEGAKLPLWEKILKSFGKICSTGLDKMQKPHYIKLPKLGEVKMPQPTLKGFAGGLGRLLVILLVLQPILQKPLTKLCHKIFGEPKTYLEKQKQKSESKDNKNAKTPINSEPTNVDTVQENQNNSVFPPVSTTSEVNNNTVQPQKKETNLLKILSNQSKTTAPKNNYNITNENNIVPSSPITTIPEKKVNDGNIAQDEIPALDLKKDKKDDSKRYIPSIEVDTSYADKQEKEIEDKVKKLLKETDGLVKAAKKKYN